MRRRKTPGRNRVRFRGALVWIKGGGSGTKAEKLKKAEIRIHEEPIQHGHLNPRR